MPFPDIDPVFIEIGPLQIRWYALAYIGGLLIGLRYMTGLVRTPGLWSGKAPLSPDDIWDALSWLILGVIIGGRLGYVLFYNPVYFAANPLSIFALWEGGMAFHGGVLGVAGALVLFARRRKLPLASLGDLVAVATPIGLFFGRIANFINGELWGRATDAPWGVIFPQAGPNPRHPSQLYEAVLEGALLFLILRIATHRFEVFKWPGATIGLFFVFYGLGRTIAELFREPDRHIGFLPGGLTMGIALSVPMCLLGIGVLVWAVRAKRA